MLPPLSSSPHYTVTELSLALKKVVETGFSCVRVKGEISGLKRHTSGHIYFSLKDPSSVLDAVCWRGTVHTLSLLPSEGMEVVVSGRLTLYPGRSKYQIVAETIEHAGEGGLLKLLEERKRKLAAEGLFEDSRKKKLPFLPRLIGIVTSPTGAVIRDILHRLSERFPVPVLLWPVAVQGEGAASQIAAAIQGFNRLSLKPDLLIVARGGGSLEDLWAFNEEIVVRAVGASDIPVISAIGHETDITLIDFVADKRAPTPTAAAEFAVPYRQHLSQILSQQHSRLSAQLHHKISLYAAQLDALRRGLPPLKTWIEVQNQRLDDWSERLRVAKKRFLEQKTLSFSTFSQRLLASFSLKVTHESQKFETLSQLLESYSYPHTLRRGFAFITGGEDHALIPSKEKAKSANKLEIHFYDGSLIAERLEIEPSTPQSPKE